MVHQHAEFDWAAQLTRLELGEELHQPVTALSAQARAKWTRLGLAEGSLALVGGILQHRPDYAALPYVAGASPLASGVQPATHLANAGSLQAHPVEHLADQTRFVQNNLVARRTAALVLAKVSIAERRSRQHGHAPELCP
jgi:hypothetical protein